MGTVTGFTAARMEAIEDSCIVDGEVVGDNLILTKHDASTIDAGSVRGPQGVMGMGPGIIPGEIRMWPSSVLPDDTDYGTWVWANGASYVIADHPLAAANIDDVWNTFDGASSPGGGNFRVPDLRGLVPAGMDHMPAGTSANRVVRSEADSMAGTSGEETHVLLDTELAQHAHTGVPVFTPNSYPNGNFQQPLSGDTFAVGTGNTGETGVNDAHENMQPTVFIGYIVALDG